MEVRIYAAQDTVLFRLKGRIVLDECDRLKTTILQFINAQVTQANLDLSGVDFIDSAGLGALVGIKVTANKHRARLSLINPSRSVSDILMVSKLDSIFDIVTGAEGDQLVARLAHAQNEKSPAGSVTAPSRSGPAVPSMPSATTSTPSTVARPDDSGPVKDRIDKLCRDAVEFMRRGDYESATAAYQSAIELNPDYLPAHNNLAIVYEKRPNWHAQAIAQWKKVLELSMRNNDAKHTERAQKHLSNLERLGS